MSNRVLAIAICCAMPIVSLAAEKLNVKTGLWEIKSSLQASGMPPLPKEMLDKLTPQQRADMRLAQGKPEVSTEKECITERDLERPFDSANDEECEQTIVKSTRTTQEITLVCKGEVPSTGVFRVNTPTPERMSGVIDLQAGKGADAFRLKGELQGRWLGNDCGDEADEEEEFEEEYEDEALDEGAADEE